VRKVYFTAERAGGSREFWEREWAGLELKPIHPGFRSADPVWRTLAREVPSEGLVLEAGCGPSIVLTYLRHLGLHVIGVDQAFRALRAAKKQIVDLPLLAADVARLPFGDETFTTVVSLGVVEHFEEGPLETLRDHYRVLKSGGSLLISVPRVSLVKRVNDFRNLVLAGKSSYISRGRVVTRVRVPKRTVGARKAFHQYEFPTAIFRSFLRIAGFDVRWIRPMLVGPGLGESSLVQRLTGRKRSDLDAHNSAPEGPSPGMEHGLPLQESHSAPPGSGLTGYLRRTAIRESGTGPVGGSISRLSQYVFGHMAMALATRPYS
jgi:SAM-dependent methyltransferase